MLTIGCKGDAMLRCSHRKAPLPTDRRPLSHPIRTRYPLHVAARTWNTTVRRRKVKCEAEATVEDFRVEGEALESVNTERPWWQSRHDEQILRFALPALMSNLIIPISSTVDAAVVGRLGTAELAGVGLGVILVTVLCSCLSFISTLVTPYVARRVAEGKKEQISAYVADSLWFGLLVGGLMTFVMITKGDAILELFGPAVEIRPFAAAYMKMCAFVLPGVFWLQCFAGVFRGLGDSVTVLKSSLLNAVINAALDIVFVFGFCWSVSGAALATVISLYCSCGVLFLKLISDGILNKDVLLRPPRLNVLLSLLTNGAQLSLRTLLLLGMMTAASILLSKSGTVMLSTFEICRQTTLLTFVCYWTLEQTVQALSAGFLGRNDMKSAREVISRVMQHAFTLTTVIVSLLVIFSRQFAHLFTSNPEVIRHFAEIAPLVLASMPFSAVFSVVEGALIGAGRVKLTSSIQSIGSAIGIATLFALHACSELNVLTAFLVIRAGILFSGLFTTPYLMSAKHSPYGYQLLP